MDALQEALITLDMLLSPYAEQQEQQHRQPQQKQFVHERGRRASLSPLLPSPICEAEEGSSDTYDEQTTTTTYTTSTRTMKTRTTRKTSTSVPPVGIPSAGVGVTVSSGRSVSSLLKEVAQKSNKYLSIRAWHHDENEQVRERTAAALKRTVEST